jgi:putative tricarboxylic transport membrane protein
MDAFMEGLRAIFEWQNLLYIILGGFLGTVIGMLPGLGPATAVAILIPLMSTLGDPTGALILMAAVYYGAMYGGSRSAILLNTPGDASAIASTFDGYPMAQQGKAGEALTISTWASFFGGVVATLGFVALALPMARFAMSLQSYEYFLVYLLTLTAVVSLSIGQMVKGFISMCLGLLFAMVGVEAQTGFHRFDILAQNHLGSGIEVLVMIIGVFAISEVLVNYLGIDHAHAVKQQALGGFRVAKSTLKKLAGSVLRGTPLGFIIGVLPGAGGSIAALLSYSVEKQVSRHPEQFGKGAPAGLTGPESANNAASVGAMIPLLTMGIPGSSTAAVMLGALVMLGVQPGQQLFKNDPEMIWSFINSMFLGNIALVIINVALIGLLVKVLAMIVGSDMEERFRLAMLKSNNNPFLIFTHSPTSVILTVLIIVSLTYPLWMGAIQRRRRDRETANPTPARDQAATR